MATLEIEGLTIVFRGDFNPKIFQPAWFAAQKLIRDQESEQAKVNIIHETIVSFNLEWFHLDVEPNKFSAGTNQAPYLEIVRDLVIGTFRILKHTPIRMMGINLESHFKMKSEEDWHALGDRIAPKNLWDKVLDKPGLRNVTIEGKRPDGFLGNIGVRMEPSKRINPGIYIAINDHYEIKEPDTSLGCEETINILEDNWEVSTKRSKEITRTLLGEK